MNRASSSINFVSKMFGSWNITIILFVDNRMGSENCQLNGLSSHFLTNTKRKGIPSHRIRVCFKVKGNLSCYQCRFKADGRTGDLMLGDFWGAVKEDPFWNRNGVSVIFVRTEKELNLLKNTEGIRLFLSDFERAAAENPMVVRSRKERPEKEKFERLFREKGLIYAARHSRTTERKIKDFILDVLGR